MQTYNVTGNSDIFEQFPKYQLRTAYLPADKNQKDTFELNKPEPQKSKMKKILFGSTVASSILTAGIAAMFLAKGIHGSSFVKPALESNITDKAVLETQKGTQKALDFMQSTSNFTAIKDWISDKIFRTNRFTAKYADVCADKFTQIANKTLGKKYDKVGTKVNDLSSVVKQYSNISALGLTEAQAAQNVAIKGETHSLAEWLGKLSLQGEKLETAYNDGFSLGARKIRDVKRTKLLSSTKDKIEQRFFKDKTSLFNLKNYKGYVTEDVTRDARKTLAKDILQAKKKITNNISSIHQNSAEILGAFKSNLNCKDDNMIELSKNLAEQLEKFKTCSGKDEAASRTAVIDGISSLIQKMTAEIQTSGLYTPEKQKSMVKQLQKIQKNTAAVDEKGALEEIMIILNGLNKSGIKCGSQKVVSDADLKEYTKISQEIVKGLKDASNMEADQYFVKRAELEVGSAATDVLSVLFPIGAGAYAIGKSDDKDERISATLTTCVPLVGTFAVFVYGTTKMVYGAKNLALSLVSGLLLSKLGNYCDKLYKNYKNSGSVVEVAKGEYDTLKKDLKFEDKETTEKQS